MTYPTASSEQIGVGNGEADGVNEDREIERGGSFEQEFHSSRHFAGYIFQRIAYGPA
jgi:hypothetical protein